MTTRSAGRTAPTRASAAGTARYRERFATRFAPDFFRVLGDDLAASSLGLGTYLGDPTDADDLRYENTIRHAVAHGINTLDTAINYRCQRSERVLGRALWSVFSEGDIARDEVIVCTKGGYIPFDDAPPADRAAYSRYLEEAFFARGIMAPGDVVAGGHCLAPSFIAEQLRASRANLGLACVDVYYLHNPEQQLDVVDRPTFLARMRDAFAVLEHAAARGEIGCYGIATWNGLRAKAGNRSHLMLAELVSLAREIAGDDHHFHAVQLPVNLAMLEAVRLANQQVNGSLVPLLEAAARLEITVVASATLMQAQLCVNLPAAVHDMFPGLRTDAQRAIAFSRALPVATSLAGMRCIEHVDENLGAARPAQEPASSTG